MKTGLSQFQWAKLQLHLFCCEPEICSMSTFENEVLLACITLRRALPKILICKGLLKEWPDHLCESFISSFSDHVIFY